MAILDYIELPVGSVAGLKAFYEAAFGWRFTDYGPDYAAHEEGPCQLALNGSDEGRSAAILPVVRVDDIGAAREAVLKAGATLTRDIYDYPGGRRFHFTDPGGLELAVYRPE